MKIQKYGHVTCIYLQTIGEILYSFDDVLNIFFDRTNWSGEVKRRKKCFYAKLLQSFSVFIKFFIIDKLPSLFFTERGATYFINDIILRQSYQDNDNIVIALFTS